MRRLARGSSLLGLLTWLASSACSFVADPGALEQGCSAGSKACEVSPGELRCVSTADPQYGCARDSCVPCTLVHAVEVCDLSGACAIGTCEPGFKNCDLAAKNGCEVDINASYDNCGDCRSSCDDALRDMPHARSSQCDNGRCVVETCADGFADCDGAATNGCEHLLVPEDCGRCSSCPGATKCNPHTQRCE